MSVLFQSFSLWLVSLVFVSSLIVTLSSSAWFTQQLENISDIFDLSPSLLGLLGALGANIPNYAASIVSILHGQLTIGLGIIIGSNIYNVTIILSISTFALPSLHGIVFKKKEAEDTRTVALYTLAVLLTIFIALWISTFSSGIKTQAQVPLLAVVFLVIINLITLGIFSMLALHALHRIPHAEYTPPEDPVPSTTKKDGRIQRNILVIGKLLLSLLIAMGSVIIMVNSGEAFAAKVHMSQVILGLVVLAVATSLPNTVVAFSLARTHRATVCVEEIFSSNSINATLGISLPLLFRHYVLHDSWLFYIDAPLMIILTFLAFLCVLKRRISQPVAIGLFCAYFLWVGAHLLFHTT